MDIMDSIRQIWDNATAHWTSFYLWKTSPACTSKGCYSIPAHFLAYFELTQVRECRVDQTSVCRMNNDKSCISFRPSSKTVFLVTLSFAPRTDYQLWDWFENWCRATLISALQTFPARNGWAASSAYCSFRVRTEVIWSTSLLHQEEWQILKASLQPKRFQPNHSKEQGMSTQHGWFVWCSPGKLIFYQSGYKQVSIRAKGRKMCQRQQSMYLLPIFSSVLRDLGLPMHQRPSWTWWTTP